MIGPGYIRRYIPACETFGWTGGPGFNTRIVTRLNGRENRNADWSQPQHSFSLPFQALTQDDYAPIKNMHLNRQGAWGVFLYRDRLDDTASNELIGTAEAGQAEFQLVKDSTLDGVIYKRQCTALYVPAEDGSAIQVTPEITVNGSPAMGWTFDHDRGLAFPPAPMTGGEIVRWSGQFSVWVRFVSDRLPFTIGTRNADGFFVDGSIDLLEQPPPIEITS